MAGIKRRNKFWRWVWGIAPLIGQFLLMIGIVTASWFGFLYLAGKPPYDSVSSLIMVWASAILVILVAYPEVLKKIKHIKIKDFEIDLVESIVKGKAEGYLIVDRHFGDNGIFGQKGDLRTLLGLRQQIMQNPGRPVVLTVDLSEYISVPKLYLYLLSFEESGNPVIVLFTDSNRNTQSPSGLSKDEVIGIVPGDRVRGTLISVTPWLKNVVREFQFQNNNIEAMWKNLEKREDFNRPEDRLTRTDILNWFGRELETGVVYEEKLPNIEDELANSLQKGLKYMIVVNEERIRSVLQLDVIARDLAIKALQHETDQK